MPAHRIEAPFKDKDVLSVIKSFKKTGAPKAVIAAQLRAKGFKKIPDRSVDRALLRLKEDNAIKSERRRWFSA